MISSGNSLYKVVAYRESKNIKYVLEIKERGLFTQAVPGEGRASL